MLLFKDIKNNYPVFVLNKDDMSFTQGKAVSVGFPRMQFNQKTGRNESVVDVNIELCGKTGAYAMPEDISVCYAGNLVFSTEKSGILSEIQAMKNTAEQIIASVDKQKEVLEKANGLLSELSPEYRERQEVDKRFSNMENDVNELKGSIGRLEKLMGDFIGEFKK